MKNEEFYSFTDYSLSKYAGDYNYTYNYIYIHTQRGKYFITKY